VQDTRGAGTPRRCNPTSCPSTGRCCSRRRWCR
jgi:hypothetical protein